MPTDPPAWLPDRRREIGENIRSARLERNLTQEKLGDRAGLDRQAIGQVENGLSSPRLDTLLLIADALATPLAHLVRHTTTER